MEFKENRALMLLKVAHFFIYQPARENRNGCWKCKPEFEETIL